MMAASLIVILWHSLQIGKSFVVSKLKDYPQFHSVAIAINRSGFKVCLFCLQSPCFFTGVWILYGGREGCHLQLHMLLSLPFIQSLKSLISSVPMEEK